MDPGVRRLGVVSLELEYKLWKRLASGPEEEK